MVNYTPPPTPNPTKLSIDYRNFLRPWGHFFTGGISLISLILLIVVGWVITLLCNELFTNWTRAADLQRQVLILQHQNQRLKKIATLKQQRGPMFNNFLLQKFDQGAEHSSLQNNLVVDLGRAIGKTQNADCALKIYFETPQLYDSAVNLWRTPARLRVKLATDSAFYKILNKIESHIPGKAQLKSFTIKRLLPINTETLKKLSNTQAFPTTLEMFEGAVDFDWYCVGAKTKD